MSREQEIDTQLAALWTTESRALTRVAQYGEVIRKAEEQGRTYTVDQYSDLLVKAQAEAAESREQAEPLEAEYNASPWSRFFLVTNQNGHVHSSMHCSTTYPTTQWAWLPSLSGLTEDDAVAEYGEKMCTVCFPSAPANPNFHKPGRLAQAEIDAKAAEKEAKQSAKMEKALLPDGSPLKLAGFYRSDSVTTLIAAQRKLSDLAFTLASYGEGSNLAPDARASIDILVPAISAKTGESEDSIRRTAATKATKKAQKEGW